MNKKNIIFISIISILICIIIGLVIYININNKPKETKTIEAKVLAVSDDYLLVTTSSDLDYIIDTTNTDYKVGDNIKLELTDINKSKTPIEAKANKITLLKENTNSTEDNEENANNQDNSITTEEPSSSNQNNNSEQSPNNFNTKPNNQTSTDNYTEQQVVDYFSNFDTEVSSYNGSTISSSIKDKFVKLVDFLFYNGQIGGKTFDELSSSAKIKILSTAISIDSKIDSKFPGYKDTISTTYKNIKSKIVEKYLDITTEICKNNEDTCTTAKEGFKNMKNSFSLTWTLIKDIAGSSATKLKNWYEIWRYN